MTGSRMKKVLIIVHLPRASPRIAGLAKYLPEYNWEATILTGASTKTGDFPARVIETPYKNALGALGKFLNIDPAADIEEQIAGRFGVAARKSSLSRLFTLGGEFVNYPCPDKKWGPFALEAATELLQAEKIDALVSSSPPVIGHLVARRLKAVHRLPWLADLRDLWSQNANYAYSPVRRWFDRRLEKKTIAGADAVTTVSEPLAEKLKMLHGGKPVYTILHGFDPADVNTPPAGLTAKLTITYTGTIYREKQDPSKLLMALRDLTSGGQINPGDIEVRFYGPETWIKGEIEQLGLTGMVTLFGTIPRDEALNKQRESQILLLLDWDDPEEKGVFTGKMSEYLAARRPIIATGGTSGNVVDTVLKDTGAGIHAMTEAEIKQALIRSYREYKAGGAVKYHGDTQKLQKYSQREMARQFAEVLDRVTLSAKQA